jgi:hypothetical protein
MSLAFHILTLNNERRKTRPTKLILILLGGLPSLVVYKLIYKRIATLAIGILEMIG